MACQQVSGQSGALDLVLWVWISLTALFYLENKCELQKKLAFEIWYSHTVSHLRDKVWWPTHLQSHQVANI